MATATAQREAASLPEALLKAVCERQVRNASGEVVPLTSNISVAEAQAISDVLCREQPLVTAEIGCAHGISTLAILGALEHNGRGQHHVVDPFQATRWQDAGRTLATEAGLIHRATFYDAYPEEVFPSLPELDFVFIDGSHKFDLTILDFVLSDKRLKVGGILGFHDTWMKSIQKVLRFVLSNREYRPLRMAPGRWQEGWPRLRHVRQQAAIWVARFISGDSEIAHPEVRQPFVRLGLDRSNLVFVQKHGHDQRDWRYFDDF